MTQFNKLQELVFGKLEKELPRHLTYHNVDHTVDVMQAAGTIADRECINGNDKKLLLTAALFHDTGFLTGRDEHEKTSCDIARQYLPSYEYQPAEIEAICDMITATRIPPDAAKPPWRNIMRRRSGLPWA